MTIKRMQSNPDEKQKFKHEETGICFWVGYQETYLGRDLGQARLGHVYSTKEDFEALIELAQAAIKELDDVKDKEIARVEAELKKLKGSKS